MQVYLIFNYLKGNNKFFGLKFISEKEFLSKN